MLSHINQCVKVGSGISLSRPAFWDPQLQAKEESTQVQSIRMPSTCFVTLACHPQPRFPPGNVCAHSHWATQSNPTVRMEVKVEPLLLHLYPGNVTQKAKLTDSCGSGMGELRLHPKRKYFLSSTPKILFPSYSCKHGMLLSISCFTFTLSFVVFQNPSAALNMPLFYCAVRPGTPRAGTTCFICNSGSHRKGRPQASDLSSG